MPGEHITQEQADEFAIGSLEAPLERAIALHLAECAACRDIVRDSERLAATFALSMPTRRPPSRLKGRVLSAAGIRRPSPLRRAFAVGRAAAGLAAVVVAVGAFTGFVWVRSELNDLRADNSGLQSQIDAALSQEVEIAALTRKLDDQERAAARLEEAATGDQDLIVALTSANTKIAEVYTPDGAETGIGRFIWDDDQKRAWFVAQDLPKLPTGEAYEIWVSIAGSYASLGTFAPDEQGFARHKASVPEGITYYESAVVTIERDGNPAKEGPTVFFVADLSRLTQ
jgi:hypothetical protein